mgnify:FL=1
MNVLKRQWEKFKAKSLWGKFTDILFLVFIFMMLTTDGRIFFQRMILKTGVFGDFNSNESRVLSEESMVWRFEDENGRAASLKDFEGQTVFLNYWATWCPPCNAEMPSIIDLMEKTKGKVKYVFLTHESKEKVVKHLARKQWELPVFYYSIAPPAEISSPSLPTTFIIDPQGKLIYQSKGMRDWSDDQALELLGVD